MMSKAGLRDTEHPNNAIMQAPQRNQDPHERNRHLVLHYGDLTNATNLIRILQQVQPDEVYNLAAQSHVQVSFESPEYTADTDGIGTLRLLEGIRLNFECPSRLGVRKRL